MANVKNVFEFLNSFAPITNIKSGDNAGFLLGRGENELTKIILSLDITDEVISEAIDEGANLIVSHHPLFFSLSSVTDSDVTGRRILKLAENGIAAICMHTNLDAAQGGVNDELAKIIGINEIEPFAASEQDSADDFSLGRVGYLDRPIAMHDFLRIVKRELKADGLRYYDAGRDVSKVAVVGGTGNSQFGRVLESGCDTFVSADLKYSLFLESRELGINVIDAGHFNTENVIIPPLGEKLRAKFPQTDIIVSTRHKQIIKFMCVES